ncbi:MAG: polysaccharide pyruvyl transferase family protein [Clostridia bacterium]|nr:polysaccharide pyruvyl transferase family protein [Clostridia bacterium]
MSIISSAKKIGIVTHYYNSKNYGGNLQAYALVEFLNKNGYNAQQISFDFIRDIKPFDNVVYEKKKLINKICEYGLIKSLCKLSIRVKRKLYKRRVLKSKQEQATAFQEFNKQVIPHSDKVYNSSNITECNNLYDVFITGSDQVWNLEWYSPSFLLDFVINKPKISYAASVSMESLTKEQEECFRKSLKDFKAISVREGKAVGLLNGLTSVEPIMTIDPTLLLSKKEWDEICDKKLIEEDYIFCYYLGKNDRIRTLAKRYAKLKKLKIISIPMTEEDKMRPFGNIARSDISPQQFLSLIKYSKYVFTDSFHAVVFSKIFEKQYFAFNKNNSDKTKSRIYNITKLFNTSERFCDTMEKEKIEYLLSLKNIDYSKFNSDYEELVEKSKKFLLDNLK